MITSYGLTALILFLVHLALREKYNNTAMRCLIWACLWPLDIAACFWCWIRHAPREGGEINSSKLILKMKERR